MNFIGEAELQQHYFWHGIGTKPARNRFASRTST